MEKLLEQCPETSFDLLLACEIPLKQTRSTLFVVVHKPDLCQLTDHLHLTIVFTIVKFYRTTHLLLLLAKMK